MREPAKAEVRDGMLYLSGDALSLEPGQWGEGYRFPREVVERALANARERVARRELLGWLSPSFEERLGGVREVAVVVTKLELLPGAKAVTAEVVVLGTPEGLKLRAFVEAKNQVVLMSFGYGKIRAIDHGMREVGDFTITSINVLY